ncbi:hypothetical protein HK101_006587 [Irineochytrium annulatum]|nr:hypothetical protein HK101_006587 [Irineochytrium annulatum]
MPAFMSYTRLPFTTRQEPWPTMIMCVIIAVVLATFAWFEPGTTMSAALANAVVLSISLLCLCFMAAQEIYQLAMGICAVKISVCFLDMWIFHRKHLVLSPEEVFIQHHMHRIGPHREEAHNVSCDAIEHMQRSRASLGIESNVDRMEPVLEEGEEEEDEFISSKRMSAEKGCEKAMLTAAVITADEDVLMVADGVRAALLNDYFFASDEVMAKFIQRLRQVNHVFLPLACLGVAGQTFVIHTSNLLPTLSAHDHILISASHRHPLPIILSPSDVPEALKTFKATLDILTPLPSTPVINLELEHPHVLPTLNGWLLGYPCLYVLSNSDPNGMNNLAGVPLFVVEARVRYKGGGRQEGDVQVMAFSVPCGIVDGQDGGRDELVQRVKGVVQQRVQGANWFEGVEVVGREVVMGGVVL